MRSFRLIAESTQPIADFIPTIAESTQPIADFIPTIAESTQPIAEIIPSIVGGVGGMVVMKIKGGV